MVETLKDLFGVGTISENFSLQFAVVSLLVSLALSTAVSLIYRLVNPEREDRHIMMQTLILLAVTIAAAMMIIGNNLARAFGLVGAVSIIRFRTAVKSSKDMAFVFLSIVIGMACGLGFRMLATLFAAFVILVLLGMEWIHFGRRGRQQRQFDINISFEPGAVSTERAEKELNRLSSAWRFLGLKMGKKMNNIQYRVWAYSRAELEQFAATLASEKGKKNLIITITAI